MSSINEDVNKLFVRDLERLKREVEDYKNEELLWIKKGEINNTAGNLVLHICGNLQHFIGAVLGGTSYERNRPFEFEGKVTKKELLSEIDQTEIVIQNFFHSFLESEFENNYPLEVFGHPMTNFYFITHLQGHLNYHLGQINYHRRLIEN